MPVLAGKSIYSICLSFRPGPIQPGLPSPAHITPVSGQSVEAWGKHFQSMVLSVIAITDRVLPGMRQRKFGRIITSTSSGVVMPIPNLGLSNALRLTLVGWSQTLAREVGWAGITANIVLPGRVATDRSLRRATGIRRYGVFPRQ